MSASVASNAHIACEQDGGTAGNASAIYEGSVRHRRYAVRSHEFRQRLTLAYIDLDELPGLLGGRLLKRRSGLVRFRRGDYLGHEHVALADAVRDTVETYRGVRPHGPIRLLANLSSFGHCFNPVSFYYCLDGSGEQLEAVVAEVTNTPWGERHSYVLDASGRAGDATTVGVGNATANGVLSGGFAKQLHVSPFMGMDHRYEWRMSAPSDTLSVHIASTCAGRLAFDATLSLRRYPLTCASLARLSATTLRTLPSIYRQALLLKLKGVAVHSHPGFVGSA